MKIHSVRILLLGAVMLAGCGGKNIPVYPALESTVPLYPFEPVPVPAYEGLGLATHDNIRVAQESARTQAMADLASNIFETVSGRVTEVVSNQGMQASLLTSARTLSTTLPLPGRKFIEYVVGEESGTVYARVYVAKAEIDTALMENLIALSQELIDTSVRTALTEEIEATNRVDTDVQALTLFHQQQRTRNRPTGRER